MGALSAAHDILHSLVDFLFPPTCLLCGSTDTVNGFLCSGCIDTFTDVALDYNSPPRRIDHVDAVSILHPYDDGCRKLIHALKYHGMPSVGLFLGGLIGRKTAADFSPPALSLLVPVPLHPTRFRERGYNQSERLATGFSAFSGLAVDETLLTRCRKTPTQTALDEADRAANVLGAFEFAGRTSLDGRHVILIDDVLTTGSTVSDCARALREGGARGVTVCVASTPDIKDA